MNEMSDSDVTMLANDCFNKILYQVQHSSLNYQLKVTPFSATVSLKKSFVKDKAGKLLLPEGSNHYPLIDYDKTYKKLQQDYLDGLRKQEKLLEDLTAAHETIELLKKTNSECIMTIKNLESDVSDARDEATMMNETYNKLRIKYECEKIEFYKQQHLEGKYWESELKIMATKHLNLERKFSTLEIESNLDVIEENLTLCKDDPKVTTSSSPLTSEVLCSTCRVFTRNYVTNYFSGKQVDAVCSECFLTDPRMDCFTSFSNRSMPTTLVSHWIPLCHINLNSTGGDLSSLLSFRSHYTRLPSPGERFTAMEDMMQEFRVLLNAQRQGCKQS